MENLPKPKLGNVSAITISTPDLEKSLAFYQKLGFNEVSRSDVPFPWIQITDGAILIMLRGDSSPYIALTYYVLDIDKVVADLEAEGILFATKPTENDMVKRCLIRSPDGSNVGIVSNIAGFVQPTGQTILTTPPQDFSNPEKYVNKACGLFGEFAHPVADLDRSIKFWEKLGFILLSKYERPYKWAIISDGLNIVGLHQTNNFTNPTITFFAADMKAKIEKLKNEGISDFVEMGQGNLVLITPEKQNINLFKLGM
jgi:catechol 2,3-dioxygenase-like lactoylglutathione lyase family enzyme